MRLLYLLFCLKVNKHIVRFINEQKDTELQVVSITSTQQCRAEY